MNVTQQDLSINLVLRDAIADILADEVARIICDVYPVMDADDAQAQYYTGTLNDGSVLAFGVALGYDSNVITDAPLRLSGFVQDFPINAANITRSVRRAFSTPAFDAIVVNGTWMRMSLVSCQVTPGLSVSHYFDNSVARASVFVELHVRAQRLDTQYL